MFGCIGKLVTLVVFAVLIGAGWLTRGWWLPKVRGTVVATAPAADSSWTPIDAAGAVRVSTAIAAFSRASGPAFVDVAPADFVALALEPALKVLGTNAGHPEALAHGDELYIRAQVAVGELGADALGPLNRVLSGRQQVTIRGTLEPVSAGMAQYRVSELAVGELKLPTAAIPKVMGRIATAARGDSVARNAIGFALPPRVADLRLARGRLTLYKGAK
ncbi:MAG: hypothetical protein K2X99_01460 [Gemmatimonadaceae bacterium]|nr:hypothetical protein [Gemmatimonadaceae bacterium]